MITCYLKNKYLYATNWNVFFKNDVSEKYREQPAELDIKHFI